MINTAHRQIDRFFGTQAETYDAVPWQQDAAFYTWIIERIVPLQPKCALELASASGNTVLALASIIESIVGIDLNLKMCHVASAKLSKAGYLNARIINGNALHLDRYDLPKVDLILARNGLHHIPEYREVLAIAKRFVTRPGNMFVIECTAPDGAINEWTRLFEIKEIGRQFYFDHGAMRACLAMSLQGELIFSGTFLSLRNSLKDWILNSGRDKQTLFVAENYLASLSLDQLSKLGARHTDNGWVIDKQFSGFVFHFP